MPTLPELPFNIDFGPTVPNIMFWVQWIFYGIILLAIMFVLYAFVLHSIRVTIFPLYGGMEDLTYSVGKKTWNRFRWNKTKTAWIALFPLFNRTEIQPFKPNYMYAGKNIFAFKLGETLVPASLEITTNEKSELTGKINPVPYYIRNWQSLTHKKNAQEFAERDWWSDNKTLISCLVAGLGILAAAIIVVYLTYKLAGGGRADIQALTQAFREWGTIPGKGPQ